MAQSIADRLLQKQEYVKLSAEDLRAHDPEMLPNETLDEYVFRALGFEKSLIPEAREHLFSRLQPGALGLTSEMTKSQFSISPDRETAVRLHSVGGPPYERLPRLTKEDLEDVNSLILSAAAPMRFPEDPLMSPEELKRNVSMDPEKLSLDEFEAMRKQIPFVRVIEGRPVWMLRAPNWFFDTDPEEDLYMKLARVDPPSHCLAVENAEVNHHLSDLVYQHPHLYRWFLGESLGQVQKDYLTTLHARVAEIAHEKQERLLSFMERANNLLRAAFFRSLWRDMQHTDELQYVSVYRSPQEIVAVRDGQTIDPEYMKSHAVVFTVQKRAESTDDRPILQFSWRNPFFAEAGMEAEQTALVSLFQGQLMFASADGTMWAAKPNILGDVAVLTLQNEFAELELLNIPFYLQDATRAQTDAVQTARLLEKAESATEFLQSYESHPLSHYPLRSRHIYPKQVRVEFSAAPPPPNSEMPGGFSAS